mmetsp:Transcript_16160/g.39526  ORF Transcript_16160/g.39526 Transcript_16160/m.39526 type:complete len:226 (-) Transcript_16160:25-702(-)
MESLLAFLILAIVVGTSLAFHSCSTTFQLQLFNRAKLYSSENDESLNSVGDYVKQVHGGKYQFSDAGINSIGQEFAETGYASSAPKEDVEASLLAEIPRWANRMGTETDMESKIRGTISLSSGPVSINIVNDERTWEPFYMKVTTTPGQAASRNFDDTHPLTIHPRAGTLAPRGGAVNLCDPNNPYSDAATITVDASGDLSSSSEDSLYVLIGTEEEKWYYRIEK